MLYSHNGNFPTVLPDRIRLSNGMTRTDSSTFTTEEITDAGYTEVSNPPSYDYPNVLEWVAGSWVVRAPNNSDITNQWTLIQAEAVRLLSQTDYKVLKAVESGISLSTPWIDYRQALRDIYNNVNNLDPFFINWPEQPQ
jgi:hypothetical protein